MQPDTQTPQPVAHDPEQRPRRWRAALIAGALAAVAGVGVVVVSVKRARQPAPEAAPARRDAPFLDGELIRFSESFARRNGVSAVVVHPKDLEPMISVTGAVTFDTRKFAAVGARIPGRVRRVYKVEGDAVHPQETLAEIESADLGRAQALVVGARAKEKAAEAEMRRERHLADARVSAQRDAEAANAAFESARAERLAAERTVTALGGSQDGEIGIVLLRSPIAGGVVAAKVARGQTVEPKDTIFEIADLSSVWVELHVFERDLASVHRGDRVVIISQGRPPRELEGKIDHVGEVVAPATRTADVRVVVDNRDGLLRPGQSVHARVHIAGPAGKLLTVPRAAISRIDGKPTVLLMIDAGTVEPRAIELGVQDGDDAEVLSGVKEGDRVVMGGLFALKSEIFR